jgi:hypothetical protein
MIAFIPPIVKSMSQQSGTTAVGTADASAAVLLISYEFNSQEAKHDGFFELDCSLVWHDKFDVLSVVLEEAHEVAVVHSTTST